MPTLNWIGKEAVIKHYGEVPFRLLEPIPELSWGSADDGNLVVQGDNLHALKALLPRFAGRVKCIYIDPPYNTGNEGWVYNDNVNSPEIRKWLGEVVGREGVTLDRHDRWLCMMYPRLLLLRQFLREDGAIFVSIDDNEVASLRLLMDEIFGPRNFVATVIWQKNFSPKNSARHLSEDHDYLVIYSSNADTWRPNLLPRTVGADARYKDTNDPRGPWTSSDLTARNYYSLGTYSVTSPSGRVIHGPPPGRYWTISKEVFEELDEDGRIWWGIHGNNMPRLKRYLADVKDGIVPQTLWFHKDVGHTQEAKKELLEVVDFESSDEVFITPKPTRLVQRILQIAADKDSLILDSFAGSGTTAHAVLKQNAEDGGSRRFILVEMEENIATGVIARRLRRVMQGDTDDKGKTAQQDLGAGFQFCRLSDDPLFLLNGRIRPDVTFSQLAEFVWFMETGTAMDRRARENVPTPYLGQYQGKAVFLLYNGILRDYSEAGGNVLNGRTLTVLQEILPEFEGVRVVYGAGTRFDQKKLADLGITFHQLPYELAVKTWF